ncbi:TolC family protein [Niveispirillum fermenti]|uniref:TolC family protein n=1 Tax=Niveispirillum fermenti TaxID=1233113 RepID=UPI003A8A0D82
MRLLTATALALCMGWVPVAAAQGARATDPPFSGLPARLDPAEAVALALARSPRTAAAAARLDAAAGAAQQAAALPNPELSVEMENFRGSGPYRGFDSVETTYSLSQTIELGGKRGARKDAAAAARDASRQDLALARQDLARDVRQAFTAAVAATAERRLAAERVRLAQETERSIQARVDAGREAPPQAGRAGIDRRQAEIALARAGRDEAAARQSLATLLNLPAIDAALEDGWFMRTGHPAPPPVPAGDPGRSPEIGRLEAQVRQGHAELAQEKGRVVPDLTVSAGFRRFRDSGDNAFLVGVSVPIPLFDQNRGAIARARAEMVAAEADLATARMEQERNRALARARFDSAREQADALRDQIVPTARQALDNVNEGYRQGKFGYLDVLDAQRTLFDVERDLIEALRGFHDARAELERLGAAAPDGEE